MSAYEPITKSGFTAEKKTNNQTVNLSLHVFQFGSFTPLGKKLLPQSVGLRANIDDMDIPFQIIYNCLIH